MRVVFALLVALLATAEPVAAANLCVKAGGSDGTAKASIVYVAGNEAASTCWQTLGRAVWGNASRSSPSSSEGAAAGDTVFVFGATYDFSGAINDELADVYDPVNNGTAGNLITFTCLGDCTLTAAAANSRLLGSAGDYIKWFADLSLGHSWIVVACPEDPTNDPTDDCPSGTAASLPDYTAIVASGTGTWIEGFVITGHHPVTYEDNWNGIRVHGCTSCTIRNNDISEIYRSSVGAGNHNYSCFTLYGTLNTTIENNYGHGCRAGVYFKDNDPITPPQNNNVIRKNKFDNVGECFAFSITAEDRNYVYQNVCVNSDFGLRVVGGGLSNDWIFNNTFYNMNIACLSAPTTGSGGRFWNNICLDAPIMIAVESTTMPADTVIDVEHSNWFTFTNFYNGASDGNRTMASFNAAYTDQNQAAPAGISSDPRLVDPADGDFRLCTGAGVPDASCAGASPAINLGVDHHDLDGDLSTTDNINAGAHLTNTETIGLSSAAAGGVAGPGKVRIRRREPPLSRRFVEVPCCFS